MCGGKEQARARRGRDYCAGARLALLAAVLHVAPCDPAIQQGYPWGMSRERPRSEEELQRNWRRQLIWVADGGTREMEGMVQRR